MPIKNDNVLEENNQYIFCFSTLRTKKVTKAVNCVECIQNVHLCNLFIPKRYIVLHKVYWFLLKGYCPSDSFCTFF